MPVVSVGNITLGGTGKTPAVEWLARWFRDRGVRVGIVSRGYGAQDGRPNDEALELADKLPDVPHVLDPDRARGARQAIDALGCQLLLLDDGFQHRRLARDFDLVLIDALEPFGYEHVFPRGTLREPLAGWSRAAAFLLTRADAVDAGRRAEIRGEQPALPRGPCGWNRPTSRRHYARPRARSNRSTGWPGSGSRRSAASATRRRFARALAACGLDVAQFREFADHFAYPPSVIDDLARWADAADVHAVVCTHKDLVKTGNRWSGSKPLWALASRLQIQSGEPELTAALELLARRALATR